MQHKKLIPFARRVQLHPLSSPNPYRKRLAIPMQNCIKVIEVADIMYLKADSNYTHIFLKNDVQFITSNTLKSFGELLSIEDFLRVHQSHLVQAKWITEYHLKKNHLTLHNQTNIPVSRSKKHIVTEYIKTFQI